MSSTSSNGKPLRFACLIRVSTERQEKQGESLRTQRKEITAAATSLGTEAGWYGGQEHATAGWEREQRDRLLADAEKPNRPFDAVMVQHPDRWSRDDASSAADLDRLMAAGVRFFVLTQEQNLYDPTARFYLGISAIVGAYHARNQSLKSITNRLERLRRGIPAIGERPVGRVWDKKLETWTVDESVRATYQEIADRYLAGESSRALAHEYGLDHAQLIRTFRDKCGPEWVVRFHSPKFGISESVTLTVPELLPPELIRAVHRRLKAKRTYEHRPPRPRYDYLLSGRVFCAGCGATMTGQADTSGGMSRRTLLYYRHPPRQDMVRRKKTCSFAVKRKVPSHLIEQSVLSELFQMFGNPAAIERAVNRAVPDADRLTKKRKQLESRLEGARAARGRLVKAIARGTITDADAEKESGELRAEEAELTGQLSEVVDALAYVPDADAIRCWVENFGTEENPVIMVLDAEGNQYAGGNSVSSYLHLWREDGGPDRRALIDSVFGAPMPDGSPAGVYVTPSQGGRSDGPRFTYELRGQLVRRVVPKSRPLTTTRHYLPFAVAGALG